MRGGTVVAVVLYLSAIVAANLSVAAFGPGWSIVNAFALIGLDLSLRDRLHLEWEGHGLAVRMGALIAAGGVIAWILNRDAGQIAIASSVAFVAAGVLDGAAFVLLERWPRLLRVNGSNVVGAAADSLIFPTLAFGSVLPIVVLGQFAAKVAGGLLWSVLVAVPLRARPA